MSVLRWKNRMKEDYKKNGRFWVLRRESRVGEDKKNYGK